MTFAHRSWHGSSLPAQTENGARQVARTAFGALVLLCGFCLIAIPAGAQEMASVADSPISTTPAGINDQARWPTGIPEIIQGPDVLGRQREAAAPEAALAPPAIDQQFLRGISLDRD